MSKQPDVETRQNIFQIYLASYKKFKYWFAIFYFLSIVFWLLLYNEEIAVKIEKYKPMREFLGDFKYFEFFCAANRTLTSDNIISNLKMKFKYNKIDDANWSKGKLQEKARQYKILAGNADSLNTYTDFMFNANIDSLQKILRTDSIMIEDTISHYHILINQDSLHGDTRDERNSYRRKIKAKFIKSVNGSRPKKIFEALPLDTISLYALKKYSLPDSSFQKLTLSEMEEQADTLVKKVENWQKKDIIDPQNFRVPLSFGTFKDYTLLILVVIAILLQFNFANYKFYEGRIKNSNQKLTKVPAINNIIEHLKIPLLSHWVTSRAISFLSYGLNLLLPAISMWVIGRKVLRLLDNYTWFYVAVIAYIIGFGLLLIYIWQDQKIFMVLKKLSKSNS